MRIGIVGSGPIGRFYASKLSQAGHYVTMLCRNEADALAIRNQDLIVTGLLSGKGALTEAFSEAHALMQSQPQYILICTKAADNPLLLEQLSQCRSGAGPIYVSCQNGIDVEDALVHHFGATHTLRMILNIGCNIASSNAHACTIDVKFKYTDILSERPATQGADNQLAEVLNQAGIAVNLSPSYRKEAFRKAILNTALGTVCAITQLTMREVMQRPDLHRMVQEIVREGGQVGDKLGYDFGTAFIAEGMAYLSQGGDHMPSLAVDIVKGNVTENQWLAGAIYHYAERLGLEVPVIQTVYYFIKNIEGRGANPVPL